MNEWREVRRHLNASRHVLARQADLLYPALPRVGSTHLLSRSTWALAEPLDLHRVVLHWTDEPAPAGPDVPGDLTYAEALAAYDKPKLFENRTCYRLLDVTWPDLTFTRGMYFDAVNVGEAAAHAVRGSGSAQRTPREREKGGLSRAPDVGGEGGPGYPSFGP